MKFITKLMTVAAVFAVAMGAKAQTLTADDIIIPSMSAMSIDYTGVEKPLFVKANSEVTVTSNDPWLTATIDPANPSRFMVKADYSSLNEARVGTLTLSNGRMSRDITVTQGKNEAVSEIGDERLAVKSYSSSPSNNFGSNTLSLAFDGNHSTFWHSGTQNTAYTIEFVLNGDESASYFSYQTRADGTANGNWGSFSLYVMYGGSTEYEKIGDYDAKGSDCQIKFANTLENVTKCKVVVQPSTYGVSGWISASEIGLYRIEQGQGDELFTDELLTELKPGVTQADIDAIPVNFYRDQAQRIFDGNYSLDYRLGTYSALLSVGVLSNEWCAPGKLYDQIQGVTGININSGKHAIIVKGLPEGETVQLKVVAWYIGKVGGNFDGGNPNTTTYTLRNGLNVIDYNYSAWGAPRDGLAYICYYRDDVNYKLSDEDQKAMHPDIQVHFVNGQVNGYLSLDKSNEEMHQITANATNYCMDLVGERVHSIWTSAGLNKYCRSTAGEVGYLQYIHTMDSLIVWQHRSLGFEKYGRLPKNKTMAYVNFTYYMFQGGFGVSFHVDQERRVLNCNTIINNDQDAIWGLSHEWGHQHQMNPYFCWSGTGEVSNNIQSYYNIMKMGYYNNPRPGASEFANCYYNLVKSQTYKPSTYSSCRKQAYDNINDGQIAASKDYQTAIREMKDSAYYTLATDPYKAVCLSECDVTTLLIPMLKLMIYFLQNPTSAKGLSPDAAYLDFPADWYEALRQNDYDTGSQVEKTSDKRDKYELIAGALNSNKNNALEELDERFPTSVWSTKVHDYLTDSSVRNNNANSVPYIMNWARKCSRLTGYNLYPYFWNYAYFRTVALRIGDYGNRWYICTREMIDEFKADMQALVDAGEIEDLPDEVLQAIVQCDHWKCPKPVIPNE